MYFYHSGYNLDCKMIFYTKNYSNILFLSNEKFKS